jgi:hypothetical protein
MKREWERRQSDQFRSRMFIGLQHPNCQPFETTFSQIYLEESVNWRQQADALIDVLS